MSFLRTIATKAPRAPSVAARFSTTPFAKKDAGSTVKDTIENVNKSVGDAAARGIEKGRTCHPQHPVSFHTFALLSLHNSFICVFAIVSLSSSFLLLLFLLLRLLLSLNRKTLNPSSYD